MRRHNRFCLGLLAAIALSIALGPCAAEAGTTVYVAGSGGEFGTIDLTTGAYTPIGTGTFTGLPSGDTMYAMGLGAGGYLFGVDQEADAHLYRINVNTGAVTDLGAIGMSAEGGGADAGGKLFLLDQSTNNIFYTMNPPSTTTNAVGRTGILGNGLVAPNAAGTQVFASAYINATTPDELASINPATGMATDLGSTGFSGVYDGLFVNGTLYGFTLNGAIITLDTSTGAGTKVATYSLPNGDYIDASAVMIQGVPEPSSLVLGLLGTVLAGSGLMRHRRRASARAA
jgi:hypothetical protein